MIAVSCYRPGTQPPEHATEAWPRAGSGQVLFLALQLFYGAIGRCPHPALTRSVLSVQSASSSGKGQALLLLKWVPQLEAPRLSGLSV